MSTPSLSEHFFQCLRNSSMSTAAVVTTGGDDDHNSGTIDTLSEWIQPADAYVTFTGRASQGHLPALDWNGHFRKAYCLLVWVRPRRTAPPEQGQSESTNGQEEGGNGMDASAPTAAEQTSEINIQEEDDTTTSCSILYRFATTSSDMMGNGVAVTCPGWNISSEPNTVETTVTVTALSTQYSVSCPIRMSLDEWHLLAFTHVFPYLKRPTWSCSVDGNVQGIVEMPYPTVEEGGSSFVMTSMEHNYLWHRMATDQIQWDMAAVSLYNTNILPSFLAVVAEAGPNMALSALDGRIIPNLPPICNWSKGSNMEGPKVGIPLAVHSLALPLQRLSGQVIFSCSAAQARVLGGVGNHSRIVWTPLVQPGSTNDIPRVGLIQPSPALRQSPDETPSFYISGQCSYYHAISEYVNLNPGIFAKDTMEGAASVMTPCLSVAIQEQGFLSAIILPFHKALCPPTKTFELKPALYAQTLRSLFDLYSQNGTRAAQLIEILSRTIRYGGSRIHEQVLQTGLLHIMATTLRLGLIRAHKFQIFELASWDQFRPVAIEEGVPFQNSKTSPPCIPLAIRDACRVLVDACCGPASVAMGILQPSMQIRRVSDLALTCLFGLALDWDLWPSGELLSSVADRYGGTCITYGDVLRSQVTVQHIIDIIRVPRQPGVTLFDAEAQRALSNLLQAMLLSSLSNRRSIARGEHDIAACVLALTDSDVAVSGVILRTLVSLLVWCDSLPREALEEDLSIDPVNNDKVDDEQKIQVAARLGRNLLISQFHDTIAPMILSRTAFSGDRPHQYQGNWEQQWRWGLLIFSWIASVAGPEGSAAAKVCGNLLLASGVAGSLRGALNGAGKNVVNSLFLPPPSMALMIGSVLRSEWSYTDLLSDRLQIMMPLLAGMIVSLVGSLETGDGTMTHQSANILSGLLTAVGGAFHRVYGGIVHASQGLRSQIKRSSNASSIAIKATRSYVPHFLTISMILERCLKALSKGTVGEDVTVLPSDTDHNGKSLAESESWVDISSGATSTLSVVDELVIIPPQEGCELDATALSNFIHSCQSSVMNTAAGLIANAMASGGAGTSFTIWQSILTTLDESVLEGATASAYSNGTQQERDLRKRVICRMVSFVLRKSLKRENQWDIWSYEMSSAVSKTCCLIEEANLLFVDPSSETIALHEDQVILLCVLLDILAYGRQVTGWCQLAFPSMSTNHETDAVGDMSAASKLLLPVLQPCFRSVLKSLCAISAGVIIRVPNFNKAEIITENLLAKVLAELDLTLTASVVGLSFASARDTALNAMATLRKTISVRLEKGDGEGAQLCSGLLVKVAEELRVRYESERRLREVALFDAYEDDKKAAGKAAAEESQAMERLIFGDDYLGLGPLLSGRGPSEIDSEGRHFDSETASLVRNQSGASEDFVLFHDGSNTDNATQAARLGFPEYEGLGMSLEKAKDIDSESALDRGCAILHLLAPYLDCWDTSVQREAMESEVLRLFKSTSIGGGEDEKFGSSESDSHHQVRASESESAADAMSNFFEFAAAEKMRVQDVAVRFLPSHRSVRLSYTEAYCWAEAMEFFVDDEVVEDMWERVVPDGNRDVRSRIATYPILPQFPPYIPGYLDHGCSEAKSDEVVNPLHRHSSAPIEMDEITKTLLLAGDLQILDITKKGLGNDDDAELEILPQNSLDEGEVEFTDDPPERGDPRSVDQLEGENFSREHSMDESSVYERKSQDSGVIASEVKPRDERTDSETDGDLSNLTYDFNAKGHHAFALSSFATPPDNSSSCLGLMQPGSGIIEKHMDDCLHVKAEGSRPCSLLLTSALLIIEYEGNPEGFFEGEVLAVEEEAERLRMIEDGGGLRDDGAEERFQKRAARRLREVASLRPKSIRYNLSEISHIFLRRYRLRDSALEIFFIPSGGTSFGGFGICCPTTSLFIDFGSGREGQSRRDAAAAEMMKRSPPQAIKQWPERNFPFLHEQLSRVTLGWAEGRVSNFDYLLHLNVLAGRSYNDICQYPVFPWVLSNYVSEEVPDLTDRSNYRDLSKPVGALNPERLADFIERFNTFADPTIPPFMYGSHYSTSAGVVLHFLVRLHPFAGLHRQLQGGHFDVADRLFSSVPRTWSMCTGSSAAEVKEITPEWYCNPSFLRNTNKFRLGTSQDGEVLSDVTLPPWAKGSPEKFIEIMRAALESDVCSQMLPDWIDLIFGYKQQGPESIKANNVYFYLTYYGAVDVASIKDPALRHATELQIAHFGQCPMQLFRNRPHVRRVSQKEQLPFYQAISAHHQQEKGNDKGYVGPSGEPSFLPFYSAPLSHWVHLDAPPPGPHAALVAVRFAGTDRCLGVDAQGIFHTFRWAWRADDKIAKDEVESEFSDSGCFVAQRELPRFRSVPRLMFSPHINERNVVVAISKTLFSGRSVVLVLSDADGRGGLGMQLVDPVTGNIRGEAIVPQIHSSGISCIATDPIGTAAGHGGIGGELAVVGSTDGNASIWRFMSSHFLPLRPRLTLRGHSGAGISAVAICAATQLVATVSADRCCLYALTNGTLIRKFPPPQSTFEIQGPDISVQTKFSSTPALSISVQGFVVCTCENKITSRDTQRTYITLDIFTVEGVHLGSKPFEPWRGLPRKIMCIPDGTAVIVCAGRGVTIHRVSALNPLEIIDEWHITELDDATSTDSIPAAWDVDFGPSLNRPVVAAAACSNGVLRLHALPGISAWSERHKKGGLGHTVGSALAIPARRLRSVVQDGLGLGRQLAGMGREISQEMTSDMKERGVGGFFKGILGAKGGSK